MNLFPSLPGILDAKLVAQWGRLYLAGIGGNNREGFKIDRTIGTMTPHRDVYRTCN
jgi:hypothetical protein